MAHATLALDDYGDAYLSFRPFSPELVALLKAKIPPPCRAWEPERKRWWIESAHVNTAARLAEAFFPNVEFVDAPNRRRGAHRYTAPPPPPPPGAGTGRCSGARRGDGSGRR